MTCELQLALKSVTFLRFYARAAACAIVQCQKPIYRLLNLELNYKILNRISFITSSESVLADIGFCKPNPMSDPTYHEIKCFSALFRNMQCKSRTVHPSNSLWRTETKDRGIYPLGKQINRISISMLSMSALFFSNFSMFN